jgi:(2R)-3-sulfolactate dehydrogenase (NADP+)
VAQLKHIIETALRAHGTESGNAELVARELVSAEADGLFGHGLSRFASYCAQVASGKIYGHAVPAARKVADAAVVFDANHGFAYPAIHLAIETLTTLAPKTGVAVAAITRSHHCGAADHHLEDLAKRGLIGLMFANTPKAIAPWGGSRGVFGTNPTAFAAPRKQKEPLVIYMSLSRVAQEKNLIASQQGHPIPEGWALDDQGKSTTNPESALTGTMIPIGGAKGAALALLVKVLAAALTASNFGFKAISFFSSQGCPPGVGQLLIAIAPSPISNCQFEKRLEELIDEFII